MIQEAGGELVEFEDQMLVSKQRQAKKEKIVYIVMIESHEDLVGSKSNPEDELVTYIWLLDSFSNGQKLPFGPYSINTQ